MFGVYVWDVVAPACAHTGSVVGRLSLPCCPALSCLPVGCVFPFLSFFCLHLMLRIALADIVGMFSDWWCFLLLGFAVSFYLMLMYVRLAYVRLVCYALFASLSFPFGFVPPSCLSLCLLFLCLSLCLSLSRLPLQSLLSPLCIRVQAARVQTQS